MLPSASAGEQAARDKKRSSAGKHKAPPMELKQQPFSAFPLKTPSASAEGYVAGAGVGFDHTKGLASFLAIVRFMGTMAQMLEARQCSGADLLGKLAWASNYFHLRECTSWAFT